MPGTMDPFALAETEVQLFGYSQQRLLAASQRASVADHGPSKWPGCSSKYDWETKRTLEQRAPNLDNSLG